MQITADKKNYGKKFLEIFFVAQGIITFVNALNCCFMHTLGYVIKNKTSFALAGDKTVVAQPFQIL